MAPLSQLRRIHHSVATQTLNEVESSSRGIKYVNANEFFTQSLSPLKYLQRQRLFEPHPVAGCSCPLPILPTTPTPPV